LYEPCRERQQRSPPPVPEHALRLLEPAQLAQPEVDEGRDVDLAHGRELLAERGVAEALAGGPQALGDRRSVRRRQPSGAAGGTTQEGAGGGAALNMRSV